MSHYILTEDDERRLFKAKMLLSMVAGLCDSVPPKASVTLEPGALNAYCAVVNELIPASETLGFVARDGQ